MPDSDDGPKNWSPLRQRFEALRAIKKIITGPRETISEAMVREALAEQYGIKPEEVTWKQIQFEVSGLLQYYPAIEMIPTEPVAAPGAPGLPRETAKADQEIERRATLLAEYKAATGIPSNRKIYGARNSGIHKPEFHSWVRGSLSADSETAKNFERFLREKKAPIPRKSKN